jgi:hypothetical protein
VKCPGLSKLEKKTGLGPDRMVEIPKSNLIDCDELRSDDFNLFFESRSAALLDRIEKAMGKPWIDDLASAAEA